MLTWATLKHQDKVQLVKATWQPDYSATRIASALAELLNVPVISRLSIIGIYNRNPDLRTTHPLGGRGGTREGAGVTLAPPRVKAPPREKKVKLPPVLHDIIEAELKVTEDALAFDAATPQVPLLDLERGECKWPVNSPPQSERGQYLFCGLPGQPATAPWAEW